MCDGSQSKAGGPADRTCDARGAARRVFRDFLRMPRRLPSRKNRGAFRIAEPDRDADRSDLQGLAQLDRAPAQEIDEAAIRTYRQGQVRAEMAKL